PREARPRAMKNPHRFGASAHPQIAFYRIFTATFTAISPQGYGKMCRADSYQAWSRQVAFRGDFVGFTSHSIVSGGNGRLCEMGSGKNGTRDVVPPPYNRTRQSPSRHVRLG